MGVPTQVVGIAAETPSAIAAQGFIGWSANGDRTISTLVGGIYRGPYATLTAYAVGDVVLFGGDTFAALQPVLASNAAVPVVGAVWRQASNKRGPAQVADSVSRVPHFFR